MDENIFNKLNSIDNTIIPHWKIQMAIKKINRCLQMSIGASEPVNFLLTGNGGTGKTTVCNAIISQLRRSSSQFIIKDNKQIPIINAFYALVPNPVTIKGIASAMLNSLGAPSPSRGNAIDLTYRLGALLKEFNTKVIILDEFHHLLEKDRGKNNDVKNWVKSLINEFKVPIVLVGTPECESLIDEEFQLSRRFHYRVQLTNLNLGVENKKGELRKFVSALSKVFVDKLGLNSFPNFESYSSCLPLYLATNGNPSSVVRLFKEATLLALEGGADSVDISHIGKAFDEVVLPDVQVKKNPFSMGRSEMNRKLNSLRRVSNG